MACSDCLAARETSGHWRMFDPLCIFCGARLIQRIGRVDATDAEIKQRRKVVLADWMKYGHAEQEIRELVKGPMAVEPITKLVKGKK